MSGLRHEAPYAVRNLSAPITWRSSPAAASQITVLSSSGRMGNCQDLWIKIFAGAIKVTGAHPGRRRSPAEQRQPSWQGQPGGRSAVNCRPPSLVRSKTAVPPVVLTTAQPSAAVAKLSD
jgi:hypothetical protein